jgi:hypothetical protein
MASNPRKGTSGFVVSTGGGNSPYLKRTSGFIEQVPSGNLSTVVPSYGSPSLNYSTPRKSNLVGDVVKAPS